MKKIARILTVFFAVLALSAGNLRADIIEINITAEITYIHDLDGLLNGQLGVGDLITGSYIYNSATPDSSLEPDYGQYLHYSPPYGISLSGGGFTFQTDPDNVEFLVGIENGLIGIQDTYVISSVNNLPLYDNVEVSYLQWQLEDSTGTALSSDALPTTAPVLENWDDDWGIRITGGVPYVSYFSIEAPVISVELVPHQPKTYYVNAADGSDNNDGLSPQTAFATIQKAIDSAYNSDTVLVADGTYTGPGNREIDFRGKPITVRSENGPENCIINCQKAGRGFYFHNGEDANSILDGLTITNGYTYGGGIYCDRSSPTIINCIITGNSAAHDGGGGMYISRNSPTIINCIITGNSAGNGGAILCFDSSPTIINCNIIGNSASSGSYSTSGGIKCYWGSRPVITNCILWDNSLQQINASGSSSAYATYSNVQGGWGGEGNIDEDPYFAFGTDYHLMPDSPCIDAGTNNPPGGLSPEDIDKNTRLLDGDGDGNEVADIGVYEFNAQKPSIALSAQSLEFFMPQGGAPPHDQIISIRNCGGGTLMWEIVEDCNWLETIPNAGSPVGEIYDVTFRVNQVGLEHGDYICVIEVIDEQAVNSGRTITVTLHVNATLLVPAQYGTIQAAIDKAVDRDVVLVADGTYTGPGNRDLDFNGKTITVRSENGPENCIIDCNGTETEPHRGFYFHSFEGASSIVNGLTIINGHAPLMQYQAGSHTYNYWAGGAIFCYQSSPTISNCRLIGNYAYWYGGAIGGWKSDAIITGCTITNNVAKNGGGANCRNGTMIISDCVITNNRAKGDAIGFGGGVGGGINCESSASAIITNCVITGNIASAGGGIFAGGYCRPVITNCTFSGNTSTWGGAIYCGELSWPSIINCILWGDSAISGPEIAGGSGDWGAALSVSYSDVQGGQDGVAAYGRFALSWGPRNLDLDPCFIELGYWDANDTPDDANDDFWIDGDYYLLPDSPCIDAGDPNYLPEPDETDIDGNPRVIGGRIDMGAYETNYIEVEMKLTPQMLNCNSKGKIKAHFVLPEGFLPEDVDVNEPAIAKPMGIESEYIKVFGNDDGPVRLEICFDREAFCETIIETGEIEITVIGSLTTSRYFYATDTIRIINNKLRNLAVFASHWLEEGCGKPDWCGGADVDRNSVVDFVDYVLFDGSLIKAIKK